MKNNVAEYQAYKKGKVKLPGHLMPQKELTNKIFKNKFMERMTRSSIYAPIVMHLVIVLIVLGYGLTQVGFGFGQAILLFFGGYIFWTFAEYMIHRFLYHIESNSDTLYSIQHSAHGIHHQHPKDATRLAMPPIPGLLLATLFFLMFWLIMGKNTFVFFPGFLIGYLVYISLHYAQHRIKAPKFPPFKKLWRHHNYHHFKDPYNAFGVSTRLWDFIFRTMPKY